MSGEGNPGPLRQPGHPAADRIAPVHTAVGILEQLTTGHLLPLRPAWLDSAGYDGSETVLANQPEQPARPRHPPPAHWSHWRRHDQHYTARARHYQRQATDAL